MDTPITVEHLTLGEVIGYGRESVVYRAQGRVGLFAIKVQREGTVTTASSHRFRREAALAACLDHPALSRVVAVGESNGRSYLVREFVAGTTLSERIGSVGSLPQDTVLKVARQLAGALTEVHRHGLIHRDIKPSNIILEPAGGVKLIDFGRATRIAPVGTTDEIPSPMRTLLYASPEQSGMLRRPVDPRSDLYSLGVSLFEAATGSPPFTGSSVAELVRQHAAITAPTVHDYKSDFSPSLAAIIATLLAKDPDDRYQSAGNLLRDLQRVGVLDEALKDAPQSEHVTRAARALSTQRRRRPVTLTTDAVKRLVGRTTELSRLRAQWRETVGGAGSIVIIEGRPGSGKSRLARTFRFELQTSGALLIHAKCERDERSPYAALGRALSSLAKTLVESGDAPAGGPQPHGSQVPQVISRLSTALAPVADVLAVLSPPLHRAVASGLARMPGVSRGNGSEHFHEAVVDLLLRLAQSHAAALLCIDDAHWIDDASARVLGLLARRLGQSRLLVLLTADDIDDTRSGRDVVSRIGPARRVTRIPLSALTLAGITDLATSVLGGLTVADEVIRHVYTWSSGSPMAARNYLQLLLDLGALVPWWGRWELSGKGPRGQSVAEALDDLELPADMAQLLLRRVEELDDNAMHILTAAAIWGPRFRVSQLLGTIDDGEAELRNAVAEAERVHLIETVVAAPGSRLDGAPTEEATYTWVHHTAREALLESAGPERLRALHQRVAETLDDQDTAVNARSAADSDPYALARHYALGQREQRPARVYETNLAAARLAMARHANELALKFLSDAEVAGRDSGLGGSPELDDLRGEALARAGRYDQALTHFRRALAGHHDSVERASLRARMAEVLLWGRFETGRALAEVRAGLIELGEPLREGLLGTVWDAGFKWISGRLIAWTRIGFGGVSGEQRRRYKVLERLQGAGGLCAYFDVYPRLKAQLIGRSLFTANRLGRSEELVNNYINHVVYLAVLGRERGSRSYAGRSQALAKALGDEGLAAKAGLYATVGTHILGHSVRAQTDMLAYLAQHESHLPVWDTLGACGDLGWNLLMRGYAHEAWDILSKGLSRARVLGEPTADGEDAGVRRYPSILWAANALTVIGRPDEGARLLARGREFAQGCADGERYFRAVLHSQSLAVALEDGCSDRAIQEAIEGFEAVGVGIRLCPFYLRDFFVYAAHARLRQCEVGGLEERPRRLAQARIAIGRLAKAARHPTLQAHLAIAKATYHRLAGKLGRADRWLARAEKLARSGDNRWVRYLAHTERASLLEVRGQLQAATYEAELALATARDAGWPERGRRVERRFGLTEKGRPLVTPALSGVEPLGLSSPRRRGVVTTDAVRLQRQLDALLEMSLASSMVLHPDQQARVALDEIVRLLNAERAFLFLYSEDEGALELAAGRGVDGADLDDLTGYASTVVEQVWTNLEPMVVSGSENGAVIGSQSAVTRGLRSIIAAPLMIRDRLLGVVYLDSRVARGIFTEDDVQILLAVANHIAIALEAARSAQLEVEYQVERRERRLAEALRKATNLMAGTLDMRQVLMRLLESLAELVPHDSAAVLLLQGDDYALVAGRGYDDQEKLRDLRIRRGEDALFTEIERTRRPVVIEDVTVDPRFQQLGDSDHTRSWVGVPLLSGEEVIGMLTVDNSEIAAYSEYDAEMALTFASQAAIGLDNARLFGEVQRLAVVDGLTQTFNRRHFFELARREYERASRYGKAMSVLMLDIDDFKKVNDRLGHPVGDEVLRVVAARILTACRDADAVGRYGGEEFALLLPETRLKEAAEGSAERLRLAIQETPIPTDRGPVSVTVSIGVAEMGPTDGERGLDGLIDRADQALLRAKSLGKNRVEAEA